MPSKEKPMAKTHIVCGVLLEKEGKYLLVQETKPDVYGKWNLPGGRVDAGETFEQAAKREAKEETGFDVEIAEKILLLHESVDTAVLHVYKAKIIGGEINYPKDEILEVKWFTYKEILSMKRDLRNPRYVLGAIEKTL